MVWNEISLKDTIVPNKIISPEPVPYLQRPALPTAEIWSVDRDEILNQTPKHKVQKTKNPSPRFSAGALTFPRLRAAAVKAPTKQKANQTCTKEKKGRPGTSHRSAALRTIKKETEERKLFFSYLRTKEHYPRLRWKGTVDLKRRPLHIQGNEIVPGNCRKTRSLGCFLPPPPHPLRNSNDRAWPEHRPFPLVILA